MTNQRVQAPPRLLLGVTLLFWGSMTGRPLLALILALVVESPNWIRSRWNFEDSACSRAWQLSLILTLVTGIAIWLDGDRYTTVPKLFTWLPVLFFPLQFVQSFGFINYLNLSSFSFFSQEYRKRNIEIGINPPNIRFNFGNFYFVATITAASLGYQTQHTIFFLGLVILSAWLVFAHMRSRFFAILTLILCGATIGLSGQIGLSKLYHWATHRGLGLGSIPSADPTQKRTNIGSLGEIKQSTEIIWRLRTQSGHMPPRLIRSVSYNRYKGVNWKNQYPAPLTDDEESFRELASMNLIENDSYYLLRETMSRSDLIKKLPEYEIRGASSLAEPLPLPGNTSTLQDFQIDGVDINPLGTVRIFPQKPIIQGKVRWNDTPSTEAPPFPEEDLDIDDTEWEGIHHVADAIGLKQLPTTAAKIQRLSQFFSTEFQYTRYLTIGRAYATPRRPTVIETFLTTNRRGHCEYFATAATLLLRSADVPTRYTIGYAVMEQHPRNQEWIVRGTHAHAWTRVWDDTLEQWIDFDPTPTGWLAAESGASNNYQWIYDTYQRIKEDFFLWRNEPKNRLGVTIAIWILGISVILYIAVRLRKSRVMIGHKHASVASPKPIIRTPLHDLERSALKILGARKPGDTWVAWLIKLKFHHIPEVELLEACSLHQQLRFDPSPSDPAHAERLSQIAQKINQQIRSLKTPVT